MAEQQVSTNKFACAKWIVDGSGLASGATHTTITAALASASSGETIFVKDGTYTEDITLVAGVTITSFTGPLRSASVTLAGKCSFAAAGTTVISNIWLETNSDFIVDITGTAASIVILQECRVNGTDNTLFNMSSTSASATLSLQRCTGNIGGAATTCFLVTGGGSIELFDSRIGNTADSTVESTCAGGSVLIRNGRYRFSITTSSEAVLQVDNSVFPMPVAMGITHNGNAANSFIDGCLISSSTSTAITIGAGSAMTVTQCEIESSNTAAIAGAGTISYAGLTFSSSSNITTTAQTVLEEGPSRTIGSTNSGGTNTLSVLNDSDTASSNAEIETRVGGTSAGDPHFHATIEGGQDWVWGLDNSDADAFVLSSSAALGTTNVFHATIAGEVTKPLQPAFMAHVSTQIQNVTGDSTEYTVVFETERYDVGSDYSITTGIFTAPATGKYMLANAVQFNALDANTSAVRHRTVTSNFTYIPNYFDLGLVALAGLTIISSCVIADMDTGDTASILIRIQEASGKIVDVQPNSYFAGYLAI